MTTSRLRDTAQALVAPGKGLLAMDESTTTCNLRFTSAGIEPSAAMRRAWRHMLITAPALSDTISGVIVYDETLHQEPPGGRTFLELAHDAGLMVGIKVDLGAKPLAGHPGEQITEGLDGLRERLHTYWGLGARFAKWRSVIAVNDGPLPSGACIQANAQALARYALLCQEAGLVPVVEPEVLMTGPHTLARCQQVTQALLLGVFDALWAQGALLEGLILKPNMVAPGLACGVQNSPAEVAQATVQCLQRVVPAAVPGIVFLSGGQSGELASSRLNAMQATARFRPLPWPLSFSFARALQHPALEVWAGDDKNREAAQTALMHRVRCNAAALMGRYSSAMETP
jgi:fructose-bisphosphate aldolase class I